VFENLTAFMNEALDEVSYQFDIDNPG